MLNKFQEYLPFYKRNLRVAGPIILTQLGGAVVALVDTIMVGWLGTIPLASVSFANSIFVIGYVFLIGAAIGSTPLIGQAYVQGDKKQVISLLHNSIAYNLILSLMVVIILLLLVPFMGNMGQEEVVSTAAIPFFIVIVASLIPMALFNSFKQFLEGMGNTKIAMQITILANVINIILNYLLIFGKYGFPEMGLLGAGVSTLISRILMPLLFFIRMRKNKQWWSYFQEFRRSIITVKELKRVAYVGLPIGGHSILEVSAFALSAIMVGWLGAVSQAANQITQNMAHIAFMAVLGVAGATTIRVSHQYGVRDFYALKMAVKASFHLGMVFNVITASIFILFRNQIPLIFSQDPQVIEIASMLLVFAGLFQLSDGLQAVGAGVLRGLTDVKKPMLYAFIAYICINLPVGYFLTFTLGLGPKGVWIGFIFGLSVAAYLFIMRYRKIIRKLQMQHNSTESR